MEEDAKIGALWAIVLIITIGAAIYGLRETAEAVSKIVVAIIGATAILLGAIVTHALTSLREQRIEIQRQRQENYGKLLEKLATFVRDPKKEADEFTKVHLYSWVVGSAEVVESTTEFMKKRSKDNLRKLLLAMRNDVGLPGTTASLDQVLLEPETPGSLQP